MQKLKSSHSLARLCHDVVSQLFLALLVPHDRSGAMVSGVGKVPPWEAPFRCVAFLPRGTWLAGLRDVGMGPETLLVVFSQLSLTLRYNPGKFPFYDPNYSSFKICQKPNLTALKKRKVSLAHKLVVDKRCKLNSASPVLRECLSSGMAHSTGFLCISFLGFQLVFSSPPACS